MIDTMSEHAKIVIPVLLTTTSATGFIALWWIRKYIKDQDEWRSKLAEKLDKALSAHAECQKTLASRFIDKADFKDFIDLRTREHVLINNRLMALENQQSALIAKIDVFMDDIKTKQERLSSTFVAREAAISERIDRIVENNNTK